MTRYIVCGITGYCSKDGKASEDIVRAMNACIAHRGPDDAGSRVNASGTVGLGQARLSIIDLTDAGHQPIFYTRYTGAFSANHHPELMQEHAQTAFALTFNGEIYNYVEIKLELEQKGYTFSTHSDTEVILASYAERGEDCVEKFNGMRAFVLYDQIKQTLLCSRDRLGEKPFYYCMDDHRFIFASELKGVLKGLGRETMTAHDIDRGALDFYFTVGHIPAPRTIYTAVKKLPRATNLIVDVSHRTIAFRQYRQLPALTPKSDKEQLIQEGRSLLEDAVRLRMRADVPVGAFLSGGLDSSTVVAYMTQMTDKEKLHTFSVGFEGALDETKYITIVKDAFGTIHHHKYFMYDDFVPLVDSMARYYDEPFADYSNFPTTFVSQLAREHVTVALSGDGGDEIFGGYMMHQVGAQMSLIRKLPKWLREVLYKLVPKTKNNLSLFSKLNEALRVSLLPKEEFYAEIGGSSVPKMPIYKERTTQNMKALLELNDDDFVQSMIDYDLMYGTLADNFCVKVDRASMRYALEVRAPFMDYRLVERSRTVPSKRKATAFKRKILMRNIIKGLVPDVIVNRGKQGFEPPLRKRIFGEEYMQTIQAGLEELRTHGIIKDERYTFYKEHVFTKSNTLYDVYKIKLYLLLQRWKQWIR